jgi:transposase
MDETQLYETILSLQSPWSVDCVELNQAENTVYVYIAIDTNISLPCPFCDKKSPRYDNRQRQWRHLDTCQYQTIIISDVPRVNCSDCGIHTVDIPWAERHSRFTALFECLAIDWLKEASVQSVSRRLGLSWNAVDTILKRAVKRGLMRRENVSTKHLCIDETSFKKHHDYVTVISNQEGHVIAVHEGKSKESLHAYYRDLSNGDKAAIESISMDMSPAFITATLEAIPQAGEVISFDKFHVAAYLNKAVDTVRKDERKTLREVLSGSRFLWLYAANNLTTEKQSELQILQNVAVKTGRAWMLKEYAMQLWDYKCRGWAKRAWDKWYNRAIRSRLKPIQIVAKMIKDHLWGIINAIVLNVDNGMAESINSKIKMLKIKSRGFRNRERFKQLILFHCGGLELHPKI